MTLAAKSHFLSSLLKASLIFQVSLFFLLGCDSSGYQKFSGSTMGTTFHITAKLTEKHDSSAVELAFSRRLEEIERSMSTYWIESEISQFNRAGLSQPVSVSPDFIDVLKISKDVFEQSGGAFNPSVGALVELWGFGKTISVRQFQSKPEEQAIENAKALMGFPFIEIENQKIYKTQPAQIDFSAVAKGYAVDELAKILEQLQVTDYMVEIGGEVATRGKSPRNEFWRIGIEMPAGLKGRYIAALALYQSHIATSGDYRNYYEYDGQRYSHTIDPRTGYPVRHRLASVTVAAESTGEADAWATALMVLGEKEGFELAEKLGIPAYFVYRLDKEFEVKYTEPMRQYLAPRSQ